MKLHEIGLLAKDPKASKKFYHDTLGLHLHHEEDGLSVFDGGWPSNIRFDRASPRYETQEESQQDESRRRPIGRASLATLNEINNEIFTKKRGL